MHLAHISWIGSSLLSLVGLACTPAGAPARSAESAEPAPVASSERPPAEAPLATPSTEEASAEEASAPKKPAPSYARSTWMVGKINASDAGKELQIEEDPTFVVDAAATKLGLERKSGGGVMGCDFRAATFSYLTKAKVEYEVAWFYPARREEVSECDADVVRPEDDKLSAASVREVDKPAGVVLWVKTEKGDKATAKKLFDAVFRKQ